jgi:hypothetical protein
MAFSWFKTPFFMVQRGDPCENHENARFHGSAIHVKSYGSVISHG